MESNQKLPPVYKDLWEQTYQSAKESMDDGLARREAWRAIRLEQKARKRGGAMNQTKSIELNSMIESIDREFEAQFMQEIDAFPIRTFDDHLIVVAYEEMMGPAKFYKVPYTITKTPVEGDPNGQEIISGVTFALREAWVQVLPTFVQLKAIKQADGSRRWVSVSSGMYEDRDGQVVSSKLLDHAVEKADEDGIRGPLLLFHTNGTTVGSCDFQAMLPSGFLVESGLFDETLRGQKAADWVEATEDRAGISISFVYSALTPDGVYMPPARIIERSILPRNLAAFPWSGIAAKEVTMSNKGKILDDTKKAFFVEVLGEEEAGTLITSLEETGELLKTVGIRFKEVGAAEVPIVTDDPISETVEVVEAPAEEITPIVEASAPVEPASVAPQEFSVVFDDATLGSLVSRIVEGISASLSEALAGLTGLQPAVQTMNADISKIKSNVETLMTEDADRVAKMVANLPRATVKSLSAGTVIRPTQQTPTPASTSRANEGLTMAEQAAKVVSNKE